MSAIIPAVIGLISLALGYRFYSKFVAEKIYQLDPAFETPSHAMRDDVDYLPTNKVVLWGHHFTSVAGAAPIIGPAIAGALIIWTDTGVVIALCAAIFFIFYLKIFNLRTR